MTQVLTTRALSPHIPAALPRHLPFLDGLRALAALWVVLSHLWISQFGLHAHRGWLGLATNWTLYSHLAVDIFIVLSGFCLILPVARDGSLKGGGRAFMARRARRILPPFYAALLCSVCLALALLACDHLPLRVSALALLANLFLLQDIFLNLNVFNGPFWSIAVEWRIYFLFPVILWVGKRWGWGASLALAALLGYGVTACLFHWRPLMIMACPWYLFLFALGICAGLYSHRPQATAAPHNHFWTAVCLASALLLAGLLWAFPVTPSGGDDFGRHMPLTDAAAGAWTASLLVLLTCALRHNRHTRALILLSARPLVTLGAFAYSIYLMHVPCLLLCNRLLTDWLPGLVPGVKTVLLLLVGLPLILGLCYLFHLAFERPFLSTRKRTPESLSRFLRYYLPFMVELEPDEAP